MKHIIGNKAEFSKTISESDVYLFAGITGDFNSVHTNEQYASKTRFGKRIVHGMLVSSFISTALGMKMPGEGTIYISQQVEFKRPVFIGDTITVELEIVDVMEKGFLKIGAKIKNQDNDIVIEGISVVKPPKE